MRLVLVGRLKYAGLRHWELPMTTTRKTLFAGDVLQIGLFRAQPLSDACGDVERQNSNAVVLPVS
jgi:hypothetical protein